MPISVFDLFKIGIGPSSSHTVGPMCAAKTFASGLEVDGVLPSVHRIKAEMYGSLGATGLGHATPKAVLLGLEGDAPETVDIDAIETRIAAMRENNHLNVMGRHLIAHHYADDLLLYRRKSLPFHPNGMVFSAYDAGGDLLREKTYYSIGGGFIVDEKSVANPAVEEAKHLAYPFTTAAQLLSHCEAFDISIPEIMLANECEWRSVPETVAGLMKIWQAMQDCVKRGIKTKGILPGGLQVKRRASTMHQQLLSKPEACLSDPLSTLDWISLYALAVNEENAAGGRVVTAPTNGAAGIIPAVLHYYTRFVPSATDDGVVEFLLTAAAIGILYKENASISGAEVGCQGEVGSACSMAAAALTQVMGGTPKQVENAAEIAMEHNLGLTCDPIGGLVQIPCIERNAMASVKAIHASRMAISGDGDHFVSLDKVIKTMRDTGRDMKSKYKETSRGGLALNVVGLSVNVVEC